MGCTETELEKASDDQAEYDDGASCYSLSSNSTCSVYKMFLLEHILSSLSSADEQVSVLALFVTQ